MTRKEKQKLVLDVLELKVNDVIEMVGSIGTVERLTILEEDKGYILKGEGYFFNIDTLINYDFKKVILKKGELLCKKVNCVKCPLDSLRCCFTSTDTLYNVLEKSAKTYKLPEKIYKLYKEILDEEVEDD